MLLSIGNKDYTRKIIQGTYAVNGYDVYKEWTDANYRTHRDTFRSQISGSFTMYFGNQSAYQEFLADLESVRNTDRSFSVGMQVNNMDIFKNVKAYFDFKPTREQKILGEAWFPKLQVKVQER